MVDKKANDVAGQADMEYHVNIKEAPENKR
jgi:hypothetical protein